MFPFTGHKTKKHFCMYCLQCLYYELALKNHIKGHLVINGTQATEMPNKGDKVYFKNHHRQLPTPFVIYADFEAITKKIDSCQPSNLKSCTEKYQSHQACRFGYKVVCHYDKKYSKPTVIYRGGDCVSHFLNKN